MRLRKILFSEAAQDLSQKTSSEQKWLVAKWEDYIKLNFELPQPGCEQALNEMKTMITSHHTPHYKSTKSLCPCPILPRKLGNLELATLQKLLLIYEEIIKFLSQHLNFKSPRNRAQQRIQLRKQLFSENKVIDEEQRIAKWADYIKLNFELATPGHQQAIIELRQMVTDIQTPNYQSKTTRHNTEPIPPRTLSERELAKLRELLSTYETELKAISERKNVSEVNQNKRKPNLVQCKIPEVNIQRLYIRQRDLHRHGYTPNCPRCDRIIANKSFIWHKHSEICRQRITEKLSKTEEGQQRIEKANRHAEFYSSEISQNMISKTTQETSPRITQETSPRIKLAHKLHVLRVRLFSRKYKSRKPEEKTFF